MNCRTECADTLVEEMTEAFRKRMRAWVRAVEEEETEGLEALEQELRGELQTLGRQVLQGLVDLLGTGKTDAPTQCPQCGAKARFERYQGKYVTTLLGTIRPRRAYFSCGDCGSGFAPLDRQLGIGRNGLSPAVEEAICWLASFMPFASAEQFLDQLLRVSVDDNTVQRVVQQVGTERARQQHADVAAVWAQGTPPAMEVHAPPERLYLSVDGVYVHLQEEWHEVKVAALYETEIIPQSDGCDRVRAVDIGYVVSFEEAATFAQAVYVEAARRGLHEADEVIVLGDGAKWIWNHVADFCDAPIEILDFYHARHHLWTAAHAMYGDEDPRANRWVTAMVDVLFAEGPDTFLHRLWQTTNETCGEAQLVLWKQLNYFANNKHRIHYARLRDHHYHIGSGSVESACKRIISGRLKGAGMTWSFVGARATAHLRATILGENWPAFWQSYDSLDAAAFRLAA